MSAVRYLRKVYEAYLTFGPVKEEYEDAMDSLMPIFVNGRWRGNQHPTQEQLMKLYWKLRLGSSSRLD